MLCVEPYWDWQHNGGIGVQLRERLSCQHFEDWKQSGMEGIYRQWGRCHGHRRQAYPCSRRQPLGCPGWVAASMRSLHMAKLPCRGPLGLHLVLLHQLDHGQQSRGSTWRRQAFLHKQQRRSSCSCSRWEPPGRPCWPPDTAKLHTRLLCGLHLHQLDHGQQSRRSTWRSQASS